MMEKKGLFIAFEGIDGCGKSTQIKKFAHYLFDRHKHNHILFTRNPYKDLNIRAILREDDDVSSQAEKLTEMFVEDRKRHVEEVVKPSMEKGLHVITDRFKLSTLAYQSAQGLNLQSLRDKHLGMPIPDMTFIIDVSARVAMKRMEKESERNEHKFEKDMNFLENVRENFSKAKDLLREEKIFIIDGERNEDDIFEDVIRIFERELRDGAISLKV